MPYLGRLAIRLPPPLARLPVWASPCELRRQAVSPAPSVAAAFVVATSRTSGPQTVPAGLCQRGSLEHSDTGSTFRVWDQGRSQHSRRPANLVLLLHEGGRWSGTEHSS